MNLAIEPSTPHQSKRSLLVAMAIAGIIIYAATALAVDAHSLGEALRELGTRGALLVLGLSLFNYLIRFLRWHLYIARLGHKLPALRHWLYYSAGFAFTITPGKAGEALRALYLRPHGISYSECIATVFVERILDVVAMAMLAALIVISIPKYQPLLVIMLMLSVGFILVLSRSSVAKWLSTASNRVTTTWLTRLASGMAAILHAANQLFRLWPMTLGSLLGLLAWSAEGVGFYILAANMGTPLSLTDGIGIYALAVLGGSAAVLLPAGIGGTEVIMTTLLISKGFSPSSGIIVTLLCRLATLWFAVLLGIMSTVCLELGRTRLQWKPTP